MKVVVKNLLKIGKNEFHKPGAVADLDEKLAKKLLAEGSVLPLEEKKAEQPKGKKSE